MTALVSIAAFRGRHTKKFGVLSAKSHPGQVRAGFRGHPAILFCGCACQNLRRCGLGALLRWRYPFVDLVKTIRVNLCRLNKGSTQSVFVRTQPTRRRLLRLTFVLWGFQRRIPPLYLKPQFPAGFLPNYLVETRQVFYFFTVHRGDNILA